MDEDTTNNTPPEDDLDPRAEREAAEEVEANHPDETLEDARDDQDDELQEISGDPGDNITEQHPTQDQPSGESGTSGLDDEDYDADELEEQ